MRKVVAYSIAGFIALNLLLIPGLKHKNVVAAQQAAPRLKRVNPDTIPAGSPTFTIRLQGRGFLEGAKVLLDGVPIESSRVARNGKLLLADIPQDAITTPGSHAVQGMNPDGMGSEILSLDVVAQEPGLRMRLEGNAAEEDSGGAFLVEVTGEGFNENSTVRVWGKASPNVTFISESRLRLEIENRFTTEPARIPIFIQNSGGRLSNADIFFIVPRRAAVESVEPESLTVGAEDFTVIVRGPRAFKSDAVIVVNGQRFETTRPRDTRLEAIVPGSFRSSPGLITVRVEQDGIQSLDSTITVSPTDDPFIFAIAPARVRIGEARARIEITGANFRNVTSVLINGEEARIRASTRRRITVVVPESLLEQSGSHPIQVIIGDGEAMPSNVVNLEVVPDVMVSTLVGRDRDGFNNLEDGACVPGEIALFRRPRRLSFGPDGLLYVTDQQNHVVRTIDVETAQVCTVAGTGLAGYHDSNNPRGFAPTFSFPNGVAVDEEGTIYVTENGNNVVRRIRRNGDAVVVDTFAGETSEVADRDRQNKINSTRSGIDGFRDGMANDAAFRLPDEIITAPDGSLYLADGLNHSIRRITLSNGQVMVETVAGNGVPGFADGEAGNARFNTPTGLEISDDGAFLFVADTFNDRVRRVNLLTGRVDTYAGDGRFGTVDGPGAESSFSQPIGLALDQDGTLYVADLSGNKIRRIDTERNVTTLAGDDQSRFRDGPGLRARFNLPRGLAIDRTRGVLYVADYENFRIRTIQLR